MKTFKKYDQHLSNCKHRKVENALDFDRWWALVRQNCFYCKGEGGGIDRTNPAQGYLEGNVVPSCRRCNARKQVYEPQGVEFAVQMTLQNAHKNREPVAAQKPWGRLGPYAIVEEGKQREGLRTVNPRKIDWSHPDNILHYNPHKNKG